MSANPLNFPELSTLAQEFVWNADHTLHDSSPFYETLARRIGADPEILALAVQAPLHQPRVVRLFAAVHYLLLREDNQPLTQFYRDLTHEPNAMDDHYPFFRSFCLQHADELANPVASRRVQTNEVARCALFLPVFNLVAARVNHQPLAVIEVGSSAGLNLNWDHYAYDYGDFDIAIEPQAWPAPLVLTTLHAGERREETLATCDQHGRWLEWLNQVKDEGRTGMTKSA